jgi:branched-chain amino acid transport system substrate-binding protein
MLWPETNAAFVSSGGPAHRGAAAQWSSCPRMLIPASKVYEEAKILMIAPGGISAQLTEEEGPNMFRVCGCDDRQGTKVADYLADHWADKKIAILNDGTTFGTGLANRVRRRLHERGVPAALDEAYITPQAERSIPRWF